jgi:quercetin dioxygenase-like cupin family protein
MTPAAFVSRWDQLEFAEVRPGIFGATLDTEQLTATVYRYEPGCVWEDHRHPEDQVTFIAEGGEIEFVVDGVPTRLTKGELALIPGGIPHSATVAADGKRVISVNVWTLRSLQP